MGLVFCHGQTKKEHIPHRCPPPHSFPLIFLHLTCEGSHEELEVAGPPPLKEPRPPAPEDKAETCSEERGRKSEKRGEGTKEISKKCLRLSTMEGSLITVIEKPDALYGTIN